LTDRPVHSSAPAVSQRHAPAIPQLTTSIATGQHPPAPQPIAYLTPLKQSASTVASCFPNRRQIIMPCSTPSWAIPMVPLIPKQYAALPIWVLNGCVPFGGHWRRRRHCFIHAAGGVILTLLYSVGGCVGETSIAKRKNGVESSSEYPAV
jgi:hypothetical protein